VTGWPEGMAGRKLYALGVAAAGTMVAPWYAVASGGPHCTNLRMSAHAPSPAQPTPAQPTATAYYCLLFTACHPAAAAAALQSSSACSRT
jgi:hypothetical protein